MLVYSNLGTTNQNWHASSKWDRQIQQGTTMTYIIIYTALLLMFGAIELKDAIRA